MSLYPDGGAFDLRRRLAAHLGVPQAEVITGAGSNELIDLIVRTFCVPGEDEVLIGRPSFIAYGTCCAAANVPLVASPLDGELRYVVDDLLARVTPRTKVVFIANPNNPTGTYMPRRDLERLARELPPRVLLVADEAYLEYATASDYPDALALRGLRERLVVLRTFSKAYGLAGVRVGYGVAPRPIVEYIDRVRLPFNVTSVAQAAAIAALDDTAHVRAARENNRAEMERVEAALDRLGVRRWPSQANFVFVDTGRDARAVYDRMLHRGVIVRPFGALPRCLRITIGTPTQTPRLVDALTRALAEVPPA
jgi:histidinol-phosphate aminotransferase